MIVRLTEPAVAAIDRPVPWGSHAKLIEIGRDDHLSGNLRDCLAAYRDLRPDRRGMAMIICDVLVPTCRGLPAVRKLEPQDMDRLLEAFHAEERANDDDAAGQNASRSGAESPGQRV